MKCRRCGAKIEKGTYFCSKCGQSVGTVSEIQEYMKADGKKKKMYIMGVVFAVILAAGVGYNVYNHMSGGNEMVISSKPTKEPISSPVTVLPQETSEPAEPTAEPTVLPDAEPTVIPTLIPSAVPTVIPSAIPSEQADGYLYPSDTKEFTTEFLQSLSKSQARLLRNEMYARHGLVFNSSDLQDYFSKKSWYKPNSKINTVQAYAGFNNTERKNHSMLLSYEKSKGWVK